MRGQGEESGRKKASGEFVLVKGVNVERKDM